MRHGSIHAKTVGGILGAGALIGDAIATGNLKPMVEAIKNWSDELMQGNLFDGGAITDVEDLVIGKTARNYAMDQFKKGNYAKGFAGVAAGMAEQAINGIAEIGEMGIAGARAIFGDKSYSEYRKDNVISDINFFRPYEESISPKIQQDIATESVKQFGQFSQSNLQELQSSPQHALVNTLHGQHAITTNSGQLVIGGVPTGVSSVDYLNAMQNPQTAQAFSTILAQTDMSSFNPSQGIGATNMNDFMGTLLSKGSTFEMNPAQMVNMAQANPAFRNQAANIVRSVNPQLAQQLQQGAGGDSQMTQLMVQEMHRIMQDNQTADMMRTAYLNSINDLTEEQYFQLDELQEEFSDRFKDIEEQLQDIDGH